MKTRIAITPKKYETRFTFNDNWTGEWEDSDLRKKFTDESLALRHGAVVMFDYHSDGIWCRFGVYKDGKQIFPGPTPTESLEGKYSNLLYELEAALEKAKAHATSTRELKNTRAELDATRAELAALRAERKANAVDALRQAIHDTLLTLATSWPQGEVPSSRLWAAVVDRGAVATVRPGQAAEGEPHRYYKAKLALVNAGRLRESRGFCSLVPDRAAAKAKELEPTFMD
jgi:hypothetical protein